MATGQNRTDLVAQPPLEANAPEYGRKAADQRAQAALPMMSRPIGPVDRPTERPGEPVTAGLPVGPGPGGMPPPPRDDVVMARLRGLVQASQDPRLAVLVGKLQASRSRRP